MFPALVTLPTARPVATARLAGTEPSGRGRRLLAWTAAGVTALLLGAGVLALGPTGDAGEPPAVRRPPASAELLAPQP